MIKVSVIVPVYNLEKNGLVQCLDSLVKQTIKDIEIIIVNDGSKDGSQRIINNYSKKYSNIVSIEKENGGQASARNLGLSKAKGEYISFVDGDDNIELNTYEELNSYMKKGYDIVIFDYYSVLGNDKKKVKTCRCINENDVTEKEYLLCGAVSPCNKIYKKDYLKKCHFRFPEGIIYEDYASIPTLVLEHPKIAYVNKYLYNYVQSAESTMRTIEYKEKYKDLFIATDYLYEYLKDTPCQEEIEYLICKHMLYHGALNFYKYGKYDQLNILSNSIKNKYPKWRKNKYIKTECIRKRVLMHLFFMKKYNLIKLIQKLKRIK